MRTAVRRGTAVLVGASLAALSFIPSASAAAPAAGQARSANPFVGRALYVDHDRNVDRSLPWERGANHTALAAIAARPSARWYVGDRTGATLTQDVKAHIGRPGQRAVLVAYALPHRDCGSYSAGGLSAASYRTFVRALAAGLDGTGTAVILEPDGLASMDCLSTAQRSERVALLHDAIQVLHAAGAATYLDIGHSGWLPVATAVARLKAAGISSARGVSLNIANTRWSTDEVRYAKALAARIPGLHAVVDTGRNGRGPVPWWAWCNPAGRGLGLVPGVSHDPVVDADLWIKPPGDSDGDCGRGEPSPGTTYPTFARGLWQRRS